MNISALIVAEGSCPDIHLTISSASEIAKEIIMVDIGIDTRIKHEMEEKYPSIMFKKVDKPEYVELIRQSSFRFTREEWILLLDPDEYLSPDLVRYIQEKGDNIQEHNTHFKIPRQNYIFGKWIAHSRWWPDYQIRLFRKDSIEWPKKLHAQPVVQGMGHVVPAFENERVEMNARTIVHTNYTSIIQYLEKAVRYANVEAQGIVDSQKEFSLLEACRKATSEFISRFFADQGYKDGAHGFSLALLQMFETLLVFLYVWERKGYPDISLTSLLRATEQLFVKSGKEMFYWLNREKILKGKDAFIANIKSKLL